MKITLAQVKDGKQCIVANHPVFYPEMVKPTYVNSQTGYGFEEQHFGKRYNTYCVCSFTYRKNHLFPGYDDGRIPGKKLPYTYIGSMKTYVVICYDLRFPDLFAKMVKPNLIVVPADWPLERIHHWDALLKARAIEGHCWTIGINANGHSAAYNYDGKCLNELDTSERFIEVEL
ncbi:MAG: nitrilase-related carbon-nitrogen hydrolase [Candidatus Babeliales bacterium]